MVQHASNSMNEKDESDEAILDTILLATLYRRDCPDTILLGEYQLGLLSESEQANLQIHLTRCPHCQAELDRLTEFLADEDVGWNKASGFEWRYLSEAGQVVIRLLKETLTQSSLNLSQALPPRSDQLAYIGQPRGRKTLFAFELKEVVDDLTVRITGEAKRNDPSYCIVNVEIDIPSRGGWPNLKGTKVTLKQGNLELQAQITDAFGKAIFENVNKDELSEIDFEITP